MTGLPPMVLPLWERSTLANLMSTVAERLGGTASMTDVPGVCAVPEADRYVVLLVDGLGGRLLEAHTDLAPHLARHRVSTLTSGVPSTTATSVTSLGTGLPPGQHGIVGYTFRHHGSILNALTWRPGLRAVDLQARPTVFERLAEQGVRSQVVNPAHFQGSGLTGCALRGGRLNGVVDESDSAEFAERVSIASRSSSRSLTYAYLRMLDHTGHGSGVDSHAWRSTLRRIDGFVAEVAAQLPNGTALIVTGDHGMIDAGELTVLEEQADLAAGVDLVGGELRLRQLYSHEPGAVAQRWRDHWGDRAWIRTREEAIAENWFGPVDRSLADRIGDVLVAMRSDEVVGTVTMPGEWELVGVHGSLTPDEMEVPLVVIQR